MNRILSLTFLSGTLAGCVAPVPFETPTTTASYPSYTPVYQPQLPQTAMAPQLMQAPISPRPVLTTAKAAPLRQIRPVAAAYTTAKPRAAAVPVAVARVKPAVSKPASYQVPVLRPAKLGQATQNAPVMRPTAIQPMGSKAQDLRWLAQRIFQNQAGGDAAKLVNWNKNENFAVLGIGQLIWYPAGKSGRFNETFPAYLNYVKANGVPLPRWVAQRPARGGPWADSSAYQKAQNDVQMTELRNFMQQTLNLQANFMAMRLQQNTPRLINQLPPNERQRVMKNYQSVLKSPGGLYPLLDYTQFKGDGSNPADRYNGKGWGLLQVLQNMEDVQPGAAALAEFMRAADDILVTRIANAPADRREARLLDNWLKRVNTYRPNQRASR